MKIVYVTGSRAEYGVMRTLLKKLDDDPYFELSLIVTGMHLMKEFGYTVDEIKQDKLKIDAEIDMKLNYDTRVDMAKSFGHAVIGISEVLDKIKPNLVILTGDRGEMLAGAIAASHFNIPIAHISGGDMTTGSLIDERIRHAITKFADIHFPASDKSSKNIISMGENPENVYTVGNPGIPIKYNLTNERKNEIKKKYGLKPSEPTLLVVQHPVTKQVEKAGAQMRETMEAIKELKMQSIVIYPNSDAGGRKIIKVINQYKDLDFIQAHDSINREDFQDLMMVCDVIIGNSSCALLEGPSFNLPAVDIGIRQEGREHSTNIINVAHNKKKIIEAVKKAFSKEFKDIVKKSLNPYARENPEDNIIRILKEVDLSKAVKNKFIQND